MKKCRKEDINIQIYLALLIYPLMKKKMEKQ